MTAAEVRRTRAAPDSFFLAVISGIEGVGARPKARIIVDPLGKLEPTTRSSITLSGVRSAESRMYEFTGENGIPD